jgi:beta-N-acetylhexosaminidase
LTVKAGVDVLLENPEKHLRGSRVGLVTNPTGVTGDLTPTLDALYGHPCVELKAVFGPEHGVRGDVQDALPVGHSIDPSTGLPVYSLYGEFMKPTAEMLEGVDALVLDIQDVGARFYTYTSTLTYSLQAAAEHGVSLIVLDRPNPVNGLAVEGNILEPGFASFIGLHPIPMRHGLTMGELARFVNQEIGVDLTVVPMRGWRRGMWFDETGLPWVQPSPNIPTLDTATVYPGTCLFEGVNVSEGRGTTRPFEYLGAPWIDGERWAAELNGLGLGGVRFRACSFTPTFSKYDGQRCVGVQLHVLDRSSFKPVETTLHMLAAVLRLWPEEFRWLEPSYDRRRHFDLLAGTSKTREALGRGTPVQEIVDGWREKLEEFDEMRQDFLIYRPGGG